jgi:hypothetical protein
LRDSGQRHDAHGHRLTRFCYQHRLRHEH